MALTATLHNLRIQLNDSDRGVYEALELRVARHPSETLKYFLTRTLGYCLLWEPEIAFSKGLSSADEPPVWVRTLDGRVSVWVEVGQPSAERLHKAQKLAERVVVCTAHNPEAHRRSLEGERIHKADTIELIELPPTLVAGLETKVERRMEWDVVLTGAQLYVTTAGETIEGPVTRGPLLPA